MRQLILRPSQQGERAIVLLGAFGLFILNNRLFLMNPAAKPPISQQQPEFLIVFESSILALLCSLLYARGWTIERIGVG
jgi:hypothetical protein